MNFELALLSLVCQYRAHSDVNNQHRAPNFFPRRAAQHGLLIPQRAATSAVEVIECACVNHDKIDSGK